MLRLKKAVDEGRLGELYPEKEELRILQLVEPGRKDWEAACVLAEELLRLTELPEEEFFAELNEGPWDRLAAVPPGTLAAQR